MECFKINLTEIPKIVLLGKESLIPPRTHYSRCLDDYVVYVITSGSIRLKVNDRVELFETGDICIFFPGDIQEAMESSFCEYYYVHFRSDSIKRVSVDKKDYFKQLLRKQEQFMTADAFSSSCYELMNVTVQSRNHIFDGEIFQNIKTLMRDNVLTTECRKPERRLEISTALSTLFIKLEESSLKQTGSNENGSRRSYEIAMQISDYIEKYYASPISGADIAGECYLNFDYANRIFREVMGCSIIKYRNIVRIQHAKARIRATNIPLKSIAIEIGIENTHYFSRIFKKVEGLSPSEYRKKFLKICSDNEYCTENLFNGGKDEK